MKNLFNKDRFLDITDDLSLLFKGQRIDARLVLDMDECFEIKRKYQLETMPDLDDIYCYIIDIDYVESQINEELANEIDKLIESDIKVDDESTDNKESE